MSSIEKFLEADARWRKRTNDSAQQDYIALRDIAMSIAPDIRAMQDALEQACEALETVRKSTEWSCMANEEQDTVETALSLAAPFRNTGV